MPPSSAASWACPPSSAPATPREVLQDGQEVTVSCAEGDQGFVYEGIADYEARRSSLEDIPETRTQVMLNLANPAAALRWWRLPGDGVGLARMEFIINNIIKIHPMALVQLAAHRRPPGQARPSDALTRAWRGQGRLFRGHPRLRHRAYRRRPVTPSR